MKFLVIVSLVVTLTSLVACGATPIGTAPPPPPQVKVAPTDTPVPATDEEAIAQLLYAESEAVVQQDIDRLEFIWAEEGVVTDANHTPNNADDDLMWNGWPAIRERYVTLVFPSNPPEAEPLDMEITIEGDEAIVISTTHIGVETSPAGDRWTLTKIEGTWKITSLTYNLEPR
ncbi:MAG: YybH family protein [Anaerolineae bacterium]